ncbi:MAG: V-type ATP synthase subunit I [Eubacteriales bacterium]|nr:V-type ATP synthase subunit I [Eubacteriales bacterium]
MALIKMKRFHMLAMKEDKSKLLRMLQTLGCVEITDANPNVDQKQEVKQNPAIERVRFAIDFLSKSSTAKKPMFPSDVYITQDEAKAILQQQNQLMQYVEQTENIEKEQGKLLSEAIKIQAGLDELKPWYSLDIPVQVNMQTQSCTIQLGSIHANSWETLQTSLSELMVESYVISSDANTMYVALLFYNKDYAEGLKRCKEHGFTPVNLALNSTVQDKIASLQQQKEALANKEGEYKQALQDLAGHIPALEKLFDILSIDQQRETQQAKLYNTQSSFYVQGWIPESAIENVQKAATNISNVVEFAFAEAQEDEEPPVLMQNSKLVTPFESVVQGFSYPAASGLDPTAIMMPFFANFFGMMLSDAGYGLVMAIALPIMIKLFNPKVSTKNMFKLMTWGGLFTVLWGALYNTWFGFAPFPSVFDPINKPMPVMMVCVALGAVHLLVGLGAAAYMNIRRGDVWAAVFDQLSWVLLLSGLGMLIVPSVAGIGKILALVGVGIILLTAGRDKKNIFARLLSGLGALYNITGWISDLLSYMRLFGMGLATGVIGNVINILVGMVFQNGIIGMIIGSVLFLGAHVFNMGINALGAYVHSCRLQYIEFFGKFYEDGGRPFAPLEEKTRYIHITKENI